MAGHEVDSFQDAYDALPAAPAKKRRIQRACDICRTKRRACDGLRTATKKCSFCTENGLECVYSGAPTTTKKKSYTEVLEGKLAETERLLKQYTSAETRPGWSPDSPILKHGSLPSSSAGSSPAAPNPLWRTKARAGLAVEFAAMTIRAVNADEDPESPVAEDDADAAHVQLAKDMNAMKLTSHREQFLGKSSGAMLVRAAMELKVNYSAAKQGAPKQTMAAMGNRRPEYWTSVPWRHAPMARPRYVFPPLDLLNSLVALYFEHNNSLIPLLHRPTFEAFISTLEYLRDDKVGALVLIVCAIGARYSDDPRVLEGTNGTAEGTNELAAGYKYFTQLSTELEFMFDTPGLFDLQRYCLAIQFLEGSATQASWPLIGIGLRIAEEVGAHRRQVSMNGTRVGPGPHAGHAKSFNAAAGSGPSRRQPAEGPHAHTPAVPSPAAAAAGAKPASGGGDGHTVEAELWRRAFWVLVYYDRLVSCTLGRPCGVQWDDFDIQLPTPVDDEYWEHPHDPLRSFRQPSDTPSKIELFNHLLRLSNVLSFVLRLLYSIDKKGSLLRSDDDRWEEHVVKELDSALNKWVDGIPAHLRWDPSNPNPLWFKQSVYLYTAYYHVQMTIHRPFIPAVRFKHTPPQDPNAPSTRPSAQPAKTPSLPSLAICTNAARGTAHVAHTWNTRCPNQPFIGLLPGLTIAGVVLLLNVWSGKRTGLDPRMNTAVDEVGKVMQTISVCEKRWQMAGLFWDILSELANVGNVRLPVPQNPAVFMEPPPSSSSDPSPSPESSHSGTGSAAMSSASSASPNATRLMVSSARSTLPVNSRKRHHVSSASTADDLPPTQPTTLQESTVGSGSWASYDPASVGSWHPSGNEYADDGEAFAWLGEPGVIIGGSGTEFMPMYSSDLGRSVGAVDWGAASVAAMQPGADLFGTVPTGSSSASSSAGSLPASALWQGSSAGHPFTTSVPPGPPPSLSDPELLAALEMDMWANAPPGLGANDWGTYFELMNGMQTGRGGQ
uniref:Zn(2)-C6 fungal-type domain-containing protein n=1 Tax=Mycena chlorophos TaxID=658473 RepID=A0ABQ0LSH7_MYCCL|nr:predicted protein [Mycena chlorophos]